MTDAAPWWPTLLVSWLPFLILIFIWFAMWRTRLAEMRRSNAYMERIVVALEKRWASIRLRPA